MHANFGIDRELHNKLYFAEYTNDKGLFHFHSSIELYFVDEGEMEVWVNHRHSTLQRGQMSVALSYDAHAYRTPERSRSSVLIIPLYLCEEFVEAVKHKRVTNPFIQNHFVVSKIKDCIYEIKNDPDNRIKTLGYIYVILGILTEHLSFEEANDVLDPALSSRLLFYINEHFREELSTASLALLFGYNERYLAHYFHSCFHISLRRYLSVIRLKHAIQLMAEGNHSVTYCAMESGFNSMRTFYRAFEAEFHCAPKDYLKKIKTV